MKNLCLLLSIWLLFLNCSGQTQQTPPSRTSSSDPIEGIRERIQAFLVKDYSDLGELLYAFEYKVKTDNLEDYEDGYIPWASLSKPEQDLPNLYKKDEIIVKDPQIKIIIDYPVTNIYEFTLNSEKGFTRAELLTEISKRYHLMYEEEEKTSTVKTIPPEKRTLMYNRNETDGKYGLWGHDIADMDISGFSVYRTAKGEIVLVPFIEA
jgi:hypothetical protein